MIRSIEALSTAPPEHDLYRTGDPDAPDSIKDSNGDVALGLCRRCNRAECELEEPCIPRSRLATNITAAPSRHDNDNPLWQGPCAEGPLGGITQSMLVRFLSCRERFRLKYVLGLEPPDKWNKNLGYGNMWHVCEESHAKKYGSEACYLACLREHAREQISQYPLQRDEIEKWYNVCLVQFPEYVKYWSEHPDVQNRTPLMQEQVFDVPYTLLSGRTVRLRGKFDSVDLIKPGIAGVSVTGEQIEWREGIYLQENKTKGDIDKLQVERQLKFDLQTMMYLIALIEADQHAGVWKDNGAWKPRRPIQGVRYNVVRRPLSGGVGSIKPHSAKATKTKLTPAETADEFYERLRRDYIADDPAYWFFRVRAEISAKDVQVFRETCLDPLLETVCRWYDEVTGQIMHHISITNTGKPVGCMNYRTPFGVWSALEEGGATEYDSYMENGSEAGLRRVETMFTELQ